MLALFITLPALLLVWGFYYLLDDDEDGLLIKAGESVTGGSQSADLEGEGLGAAAVKRGCLFGPSKASGAVCTDLTARARIQRIDLIKTAKSAGRAPCALPLLSCGTDTLAGLGDVPGFRCSAAQHMTQNAAQNAQPIYTAITEMTGVSAIGKRTSRARAMETIW